MRTRAGTWSGMLVVGLLLAALFMPGVAHAVGMGPISHPSRTVIDSISRNWAGYAAFKFGTTFTAVRAHWVQPAVSCPNQPAKSVASFEIGIDGFKSSTIEEIGTDARCTDGAPSYIA